MSRARAAFSLGLPRRIESVNRTFRVVQWATGSMGRTALRRIIDHPDLELVGVYVYDEKKAGRDAGELVRRPPTGVRASHRIEDIIALRPDVVIHAPRLSEPYELQNAEVLRLLGAGINVISIAQRPLTRWPPSTANTEPVI